MEFQDIVALTLAIVALAYVMRSFKLTLNGGGKCHPAGGPCTRHNDRSMALTRTPLVSVGISRLPGATDASPSKRTHPT